MSTRASTDEFSVVVVSMKNKEEEFKSEDHTVVLTSEQDDRQGKDELNIVELPFALISNRNAKQIKTLKKQWTGQDRVGKSKQCYQTITGSDNRGLPTFQAEMVAIAAMELTFKKPLDASVVNTTQYEMCQLLGWPYTNRYRKLLRSMFALLTGLTVETNHFYNSETGEHEWAVFGVIDNAQFGSGKGFFKWNDVLFKSFKRGNIKSLDTQAYFSLKRNLAKRLFRYADRHVYNGQKHEIDLKRLCYDKLLMLGEYQGVRHLVREIEPAIDEVNKLQKDGVRLFGITMTRSKTTASGFKVVFRRPRKRAQRAQEDEKGDETQEKAEKAPETENMPSEGTSEANQELVDRLVAYKLSENVAKRFVQDKPEIVEHQLAVMDFMLSNPDHRIKNPAGRLRKAIQEEWFEEPKGFLSKEQREHQERDKQDLLTEFREAAAKVKTEVGEWAELPPEKRINFFFLDEWIKTFRNQHKRTPTDEEQDQRVSRMVEDLRTPDQELKHRLSILQADIEAKAREQGIDLDLSASEPRERETRP